MHRWHFPKPPVFIIFMHQIFKTTTKKTTQQLMIQKKMLSLTPSQLHHLYRKELPKLFHTATQSATADEFKNRLILSLEDAEEHKSKQIRSMIDFDQKEVFELSTEEHIRIETITLLWMFLTGSTAMSSTQTDMLIDLFNLFKTPEEHPHKHLSSVRLKNYGERWKTGLNEEVIEVREQNKARIIPLLITKIEQRKSVSTSRYVFQEGISFTEKYQMVQDWWNDHRFHLRMAIKSPGELNRFLDYTLSSETMTVLNNAKKKGIPFFVTPYYLSLLDTSGHSYDDQTIRSYILYSSELVDTYGNIRAWEKEDIVEAEKPNAAGWLLPNAHNIHRRYPEVAILIPDTMGRACGGLCASCQRMYDFQREGLTFELDKLQPKETWEKKLRRLMTYFEEDTQLRDILITGGDALMSKNSSLRVILDAVYKMALRKRKANTERPEGEKYAELQRVRLGTRLPVYLPMRINDELYEILRAFKEKASLIGVQQFVIQTHFQSPLEITPQAKDAIQKIIAAGWSITNQLVFTVAASRRGHTAKLRRTLNHLGVVCYYTFSVKGFHENYAMFTPNSRSIQEGDEEKRAGRMDAEQQTELARIINKGDGHTDEQIRRFMKKHHLPFLATDRNVLNLPGIGKSMTFRTVGITEEGKRLLEFSHDHTRKHSPIIGQMKKVYIVENKSISAYLRQLDEMGENIEDYASIWQYTKGDTEPRFKTFEYPSYNFQITDRLSNIEI